MRVRAFVAVLLAGVLTGCTTANGQSAAGGHSTPLPPSPRPVGSPAVLLGAGDIATCDGTGDSRTLAVLQRFAGTVFTLGDNAYPDGSRSDFATCYGPAWGRVKARTRPAVGNHEYHRSRDAAAYFDYFGAAAGPRGKGYYSYEAGAWHVVVLNTTCSSVPGGCGKGSAQERWLWVGTGGAALYPFGRIAATSERRDDTTFGVLRLTLRPGGYRWDFLHVSGGSFTDSGTGSCH